MSWRLDIIRCLKDDDDRPGTSSGARPASSAGRPGSSAGRQGSAVGRLRPKSPSAAAPVAFKVSTRAKPTVTSSKRGGRGISKASNPSPATKAKAKPAKAAKATAPKAASSRTKSESKSNKASESKNSNSNSKPVARVTAAPARPPSNSPDGIIAHLIAHPTLTALDLSQSKIGDAGLVPVLEHLQAHPAPNLRYLDCRASACGMGGAGLVAELLQSGLMSIRSINVADNKMGCPCGAAFGDALVTNSTLTSLDLSGNSVGEVGCGRLGEGLRENEHLTDLNLDQNGVGDTGAFALATALRLNESLTGLSLNKNSITSVGCIKLAAALERRGKIVSLSVADNRVGGEGAEALASVLAAHPSFAVLDMSNTGLTEEGFEELVDVMSEPGRVSALNVSRNRLGSRKGNFGKAIVNLLRNPSLRTLDVSGTYPSPADTAAVQMFLISAPHRRARLVGIS